MIEMKTFLYTLLCNFSFAEAEQQSVVKANVYVASSQSLPVPARSCMVAACLYVPTFAASSKKAAVVL